MWYFNGAVNVHFYTATQIHKMTKYKLYNECILVSTNNM